MPVPKWTRRKYSKEALTKAVANNFSIRAVLKELGIVPAGGNYQTIRSIIRKFGLDISHFTGKGHLKGRHNIWMKPRPLEEVLVENSDCQRSQLRKRLIKNGYFEEKCYKCNRTEWNGQPISLELEHKNGVNNDNRIENLTILCPNCHAQTDTYRGRNKNKNKKIA